MFAGIHTSCCTQALFADGSYRISRAARTPGRLQCQARTSISRRCPCRHETSLNNALCVRHSRRCCWGLRAGVGAPWQVQRRPLPPRLRLQHGRLAACHALLCPQARLLLLVAAAVADAGGGVGYGSASCTDLRAPAAPCTPGAAAGAACSTEAQGGGCQACLLCCCHSSDWRLGGPIQAGGIRVRNGQAQRLVVSATACI